MLLCLPDASKLSQLQTCPHPHAIPVTPATSLCSLPCIHAPPQLAAGGRGGARPVTAHVTHQNPSGREQQVAAAGGGGRGKAGLEAAGVSLGRLWIVFQWAFHSGCALLCCTPAVAALPAQLVPVSIHQGPQLACCSAREVQLVGHALAHDLGHKFACILQHQWSAHLSCRNSYQSVFSWGLQVSTYPARMLALLLGSPNPEDALSRLQYLGAHPQEQPGLYLEKAMLCTKGAFLAMCPGYATWRSGRGSSQAYAPRARAGAGRGAGTGRGAGRGAGGGRAHGRGSAGGQGGGLGWGSKAWDDDM